MQFHWLNCLKRNFNPSLYQTELPPSILTPNQLTSSHRNPITQPHNHQNLTLQYIKPAHQPQTRTQATHLYYPDHLSHSTSRNWLLPIFNSEETRVFVSHVTKNTLPPTDAQINIIIWSNVRTSRTKSKMQCQFRKKLLQLLAQMMISHTISLTMRWMALMREGQSDLQAVLMELKFRFWLMEEVQTILSSHDLPNFYNSQLNLHYGSRWLWEMGSCWSVKELSSKSQFISKDIHCQFQHMSCP